MIDRRIEAGCATHLAQRETNEDHAVAGTFGGGGYVIVADGVGGEPWGGEASSTACTWAEASMLHHLMTAIDAGIELDLEHLVSLAFRNAHLGLNKLASDPKYRFGLKTTLIVALIYHERIAWTYVGDGSLWLLNATSGSLVPLLQPMANEAGELTGVMSPWHFQEPRVEIGAWPTGGVLIATTDGLADPIPPEGFGVLSRELLSSPLAVPEVLQQLLDACSLQVDHFGPIFTDNMGIAALREVA